MKANNAARIVKRALKGLDQEPLIIPSIFSIHTIPAIVMIKIVKARKIFLKDMPFIFLFKFLLFSLKLRLRINLFWKNKPEKNLFVSNYILCLELMEEPINI